MYSPLHIQSVISWNPGEPIPFFLVFSPTFLVPCHVSNSKFPPLLSSSAVSYVSISGDSKLTCFTLDGEIAPRTVVLLTSGCCLLLEIWKWGNIWSGSVNQAQHRKRSGRDEAAGRPEPFAAASLSLRRFNLHLPHLPARLRPQLGLHARGWEPLWLRGGSSQEGEGALVAGTSGGTLQSGELTQGAGDITAAWAGHPGQDVRVHGQAVPKQGLSGNERGHQRGRRGAV